MVSFKNDYSEGALPELMEALMETNLEQTVGYGMDEYCEAAAERIRGYIQDKSAAVHFLVGGTQTNQTCICAFLRPYEAAVGVATAHINVHETGAVEATGHKVLTAPGRDGKLYAVDVREIVAAHEDEHMVKPRLVYVSDSTEIGTIYTKAELTELSECCRELGLYLFLDGARLGSALTAEGNDLTLLDIARLTDAFSIGGTKNGALFGEAVVITRRELNENFRYVIKQHGGMLAKGRLLGVQFERLFRDDLYFRAAKHANVMAMRIKQGLTDCGVGFLTDSVTNQQFPVFSEEEIAKLAEHFLFERGSRVDETHCAIRFCTSWATKPEAVEELVAYVRELRGAYVA